MLYEQQSRGESRRVSRIEDVDDQLGGIRVRIEILDDSRRDGLGVEIIVNALVFRDIEQSADISLELPGLKSTATASDRRRHGVNAPPESKLTNILERVVQRAVGERYWRYIRREAGTEKLTEVSAPRLAVGIGVITTQHRGAPVNEQLAPRAEPREAQRVERRDEPDGD